MWNYDPPQMGTFCSSGIILTTSVERLFSMLEAWTKHECSRLWGFIKMFIISLSKSNPILKNIQTDIIAQSGSKFPSDISSFLRLI